MERRITITIEDEQHEDDYHSTKQYTETLRVDDTRGVILQDVISNAAHKLAAKLTGAKTRPQEGGR